MVFSIRKWTSRIKFMLLFSICTVILYHVLLIVTGWVEPLNKYREPAGRAVKVFQHEHISIPEHGTLTDRLRLFYWYGE